MEYEAETTDVIAVMDHFEIQDTEKPVFVEQVYEPNNKIYSLQLKAAPNMTFLGKEKSDPDDKFDYCLAIYNRTTKAVEYKPITMLKFEGHYKIDPLMLQGKEKKKRVNYQADHSINSTSYADQRRLLTAQFGSEKKNKLLEAALRRTIKDETLSTLGSSTFNSQNTVAGNNEELKAFATTDSVVLPPPNRDAQVPSEIYPLSLFCDELMAEQYGDEAIAYFREYGTTKKLIALGFSKVVVDCLEGFLESKTHSKMEAVVMLKFCIMSAYVSQIYSARGRMSKGIEWSSLAEYQFPDCLPGIVHGEFFSQNFTWKRNSMQQKSGTARFSHTEGEKICSWFLCLYLVLCKFIVPVSPLTTYLGLSEQKCGKILTALGCVLTTATPEEAIRLDTTRIARLYQVPTANKKMLRKRKA